MLIHGPRQSGKTTLAQTVGGKRGYRYFNLDDDVLRAAAEEDPMGFVGDLPERAILDEVQRVPAVFTALKSAIYFYLDDEAGLAQLTYIFPSDFRHRSLGCAQRTRRALSSAMIAASICAHWPGFRSLQRCRC